MRISLFVAIVAALGLPNQNSKPGSAKSQPKPWTAMSFSCSEPEKAEVRNALHFSHASKPDKPTEKDKLWAAITVNEPVFEQRKVEASLGITFALVNDSDNLVDPKLESSRLLINGKAHENWQHAVGEGLQPKGADGLRPGEYLLFAQLLGDIFSTPGVYKVSWQGEKFHAPEIQFRVMPKK